MGINTGTLEYWALGSVPVIVDTDTKDLGSLEYWSYGGVPVIYQQTTSEPPPVNVSVDTAYITITAYNPIVSTSQAVNVSVDTGYITLIAYDATVKAGINALIDTASLTLTAQSATATTTSSVDIVPETGVISISVYDPVVNLGATVELSVASINIAANNPFVTSGAIFNPVFNVYDDAGDGIANAHVAIYQYPTLDLVAEGYTNELGEVSFTGIAAGTYKVEISHPTKQTYSVIMPMGDGDDFKYRLYRRNSIVITPCGALVNLAPSNPTNNLYM